MQDFRAGERIGDSGAESLGMKLSPHVTTTLRCSTNCCIARIGVPMRLYTRSTEVRRPRQDCDTCRN
jgi:hypothetical protein